MEADDWLQLQGDAGRSGNAPGLSLADSMGLIRAIPLGDVISTSPVIGLSKVYENPLATTAQQIQLLPEKFKRKSDMIREIPAQNSLRFRRRTVTFELKQRWGALSALADHL